MSDYLADLLSRSFGAAKSIRPRLPSVFEPSSYVAADTALLPESPPRVEAAVPARHDQAPAEPRSPRPYAVETPAHPTEANGDTTRVDPGSPEPAVLPQVTRPRGLDTIVSDPASREADEALISAPLEKRINQADPAPATRKSEPGARRVPLPAWVPPDSKTSFAERREHTPAPGRQAPSYEPPQPEAAGVDLRSEQRRRHPKEAIRPVVKNGVRRHSGFAQQHAEVESAVAPKVLPMTAPPVGRSDSSSQPDRPTIKVHIGRIEVRAAPPEPPAPPHEPLRPRPPALSLDDYLDKRSGGSR